MKITREELLSIAQERQSKEFNGPERSGVNLSLTAGLVVLAIDSEEGGFVVPKSSLEKAVAVATLATHGVTEPSKTELKDAANIGLKAAIEELATNGFIEQPASQRKPKITGQDAVNRWARMQSCLHSKVFNNERDRELAALAAWGGILSKRLSRRDERQHAKQALRRLNPQRAGKSQSLPLSTVLIGTINGYDLSPTSSDRTRFFDDLASLMNYQNPVTVDGGHNFSSVPGLLPDY